jgi:hypothetical protein
MSKWKRRQDDPDEDGIPQQQAALGDWLLKFSEHWQSAYQIVGLLGYKYPVLLANPLDGFDKPPPEFVVFERSDYKQIPLPDSLMRPFKEPADPGRFYCLVTKKDMGSFIGAMLPSPKKPSELPHVVVARWGSDKGIKI